MLGIKTAWPPDSVTRLRADSRLALQEQGARRAATRRERRGRGPPARWAGQARAALNSSTCEQVFTVLKMC